LFLLASDDLLLPLILSLSSFNTSELVLGKFKIIKKKRNSKYRNAFYINVKVKRNLSRKEVFQPHLPVRLPCYDLTPVTGFTLGDSLRLSTLDTPNFHCLTGGVYKARERIHRNIADFRLLANPASWSRVADSNPNWDKL
jgi:hypothetical protein